MSGIKGVTLVIQEKRLLWVYILYRFHTQQTPVTNTITPCCNHDTEVTKTNSPSSHRLLGEVSRPVALVSTRIQSNTAYQFQGRFLLLNPTRDIASGARKMALCEIKHSYCSRNPALDTYFLLPRYGTCALPTLVKKQ